MAKQKVRLALTRATGKPSDLQALIDLFKKITGRTPTADEIAEAKKELAKSSSD